MYVVFMDSKSSGTTKAIETEGDFCYPNTGDVISFCDDLMEYRVVNRKFKLSEDFSHPQAIYINLEKL